MTPGVVSCADAFGPSDDPVSDSNVSTSNGVADVLDQNQEWAAEEIDEFDIAELSASVSVALGAGGGDGGNSPGRAAAFNLQDRNVRNRMKGRLQAKPMPALLSLPSINNRRGSGLSEINQRITDLRMGGNNQTSTVQSPQTGNRPTSHLLGQTMLLPGSQQEIRRDSNATTVSSYYGSMRSGASPLPFSRRSSEVSQISNVSGRAALLSSPYDPISPGSSRRSSEASNFQAGATQTNVYGMAQPSQHQQVGVVSNQPLTASMAAQLQKMQRRALIMQNMTSTQNLVLQTQNMSLSQQNLAAANANSTNTHLNTTGWNGQAGNQNMAYPRQSQTPGAVMPSYTQQPTQGQREMRRASDPVRPMAAQTAVPLPPLSSALQRHHSVNNVQQPIMRNAVGNGNQVARVNGYPPNHPNGGIVLEEVGEGHMVEEKLVVPDEMLQYLNQVKFQFNQFKRIV